METSTLRKLLMHWMHSIKHPSSSTSNSNDNGDNNHREIIAAQVAHANASLTLFEKTYVSFPEFIDEPRQADKRQPVTC